MDENDYLSCWYENNNGDKYKIKAEPGMEGKSTILNLSFPESENEWEQEYHVIYNSYILEHTRI